MRRFIQAVLLLCASVGPAAAASPGQLEVDNGWVRLWAPEKGGVGNLDFKLYTMLYVTIDKNGSSLLPGNIFMIAADTPGIDYGVQENNDVVFAVHATDLQFVVDDEARQLRKRLGTNDVSVSEFMAVQLEYDISFGNHFRNFVSVRVFSDKPFIKDNAYLTKHLFDDTKSDYEKNVKLDDHHLVGWQDDSGRDAFVEKVMSNIIQ